MDWKLAIEEERAAFRRIVGLLYALADLAELSVNRSPAVRSFVLWILQQAEAVARDTVEAPDMAPASTLLGPSISSTAEAMRLAASLRALARLLEVQIEWICRICRDDTRRSAPPSFGCGYPLSMVHAQGASAKRHLPVRAARTTDLASIPDTS